MQPIKHQPSNCDYTIIGKWREPKSLYFLLGSSIPFITIGPEIAAQTYISPSILLGIIAASLKILDGKVSSRFLFQILMLTIFLATSIFRHPSDTYLASIAALFSATLPLTITNISNSSHRSLIAGFTTGFMATATLMWLDIFFQNFNLSTAHGALALFTGRDSASFSSHNWFIAYFRPQAFFSEPSHLAIYLAFAYVIFDMGNQKSGGILKSITLSSILALGSIVGYILLATYVTFIFFSSTNKINSRRTSWLSFVIAAFLIIFFTSLPQDSFNNLLNQIEQRFLVLTHGVSIDSIESSEGSRILAFAALPTFWIDQGISGFLFGTGYGNYQEWLIGNYYNFSTFASFARGHVDNIFVVVMLSTGFIGFMFYIIFIYFIIRTIPAPARLPVTIFFTAFHFATGFLIQYLHWHLLFVLLSVSRTSLLNEEPKTSTPILQSSRYEYK
ncbi:hypothetical protein [Hydrogenophaga taeniospiralis]|uniref:hypothetical protein n=1 Tax=Hydrogenophaga taeniospiralis TaxID=65656 RepID=UPI001CFB3E79|nr:hypothetical protein [Hydrogenophaga taeniospiralis]UCU92215.1 hypothetical protein KI616_15225 [Hydrogenophaga taeniospiralis]